jgi:hypothetical protein
VRQQERRGIRRRIFPRGGLVDEVQVDAVQRKGELAEAIDARLLGAFFQ